MDYGEFYGTRVAATPEDYVETGTFTPYAYALGISFSQKVSDRFSYGVHLQARNAESSERLGGARRRGYHRLPGLLIKKRKYEESEFALDVGAYYDFFYNGIRFGATLQNISREIPV